jgi:hypothetical protein
MLVVRAWPDHPPAGRARVEDGWPRVAVDNYDYRGLAALGENVISLDWDTAVSPEDLRAFAARAAADPERPLVGPCRLYQDGTVNLPQPMWNVKRFNPGFVTLRYVEEGEPSCHLFGFGMVYLPHVLITKFIAANPGRIMDDTSFSGWHHHNIEPETAIDWTVRPVHLHFEIPAGGRI